jgi:hypothetical protein
MKTSEILFKKKYQKAKENLIPKTCQGIFKTKI